MNFNGIVDCCFRMWKHSLENGEEPITVTVLGPPGTGKTSAGRHLATRMTEFVQQKNPNAAPAILVPGGALDLSSMLPEDLMGMPDTKDIDPRTGKRVTKYIPQSWLAPFCEEGAYGVLILDDLPAAGGQVQVACRQVSLERRIHDMKLAPGVFVIVTGNRREDKSAASTLPAHFRNSVMLLPYSPDFVGWEQWYMSRGYDTDVPAFLNYRPNFFSCLPKDADKRGAFATPRSWSLLGKALGGLAEDDVMEAAAGLVGQGVASEYAAFRMLRRELVSPEEVLANPERALPDLNILSSPDRYISLATGLGELAARKAKGRESQAVLTKYLQAVSYVTSRKREYASVSVSTFRACDGTMKDLLVAARLGNKDPAIRSLIQYLHETING